MSEERQQEERARLEAERAAAEAEIRRLQEELEGSGERLREEAGEDPRASEARAERRRATAALTAARQRARTASVQLKLLELRGEPYGLIAGGGEVLGVLAIAIPKGASSEARAKLIAATLAPELAEAAKAIGVVPAASAERYTRERPGRDAEGRTILDVAGRVEGDVLVPAVAAANRKGR